MRIRPCDEHLFLNAVFVYADALSVERGEIIRANLGIVRRDKSQIVLGAHAFGGIQDLLCPLRGIGDIAQKIDLPCHQLLKQLRPAALHIFIGPAGEHGDPSLIFIAIAGFSSELIGPVKRGFIPADPDHFRARFLCPQNQRRKNGKHQRSQP